MNTRLILKKIYETHSLPIYVITDGDPYGIEIMLTYRHGSLVRHHAPSIKHGKLSNKYFL